MVNWIQDKGIKAQDHTQVDMMQVTTRIIQVEVSSDTDRESTEVLIETMIMEEELMIMKEIGIDHMITMKEGLGKQGAQWVIKIEHKDGVRETN